MRRKKGYLLQLLLGILFLGIFIYIIFNFDPSKTLAIGSIFLPSFIFFYLTLFLSLLFLGWGLLKNIRRGILIAIGISVILILRMTGFKDLLYTLIPIIIVLLVEILFASGNKLK